MVFSFLNKFGAAYLTARDRKDSVIEARQRREQSLKDISFLYQLNENAEVNDLANHLLSCLSDMEMPRMHQDEFNGALRELYFLFSKYATTPVPEENDDAFWEKLIADSSAICKKHGDNKLLCGIALFFLERTQRIQVQHTIQTRGDRPNA